MSLATLFKVPASPADLSEFSIANAAEHNEVAAAALRQKRGSIISLPIEPINHADLTGWAAMHSTMHINTNDVLGTGSNDLEEIDFEDEEKLANWIWLHREEHRLWRQVLGI